ncbi:MAG: hypothetical protein ACRC0L_01540, partial [Angustibacter sp.]
MKSSPLPVGEAVVAVAAAYELPVEVVVQWVNEAAGVPSDPRDPLGGVVVLPGAEDAARGTGDSWGLLAKDSRIMNHVPVVVEPGRLLSVVDTKGGDWSYRVSADGGADEWEPLWKVVSDSLKNVDGYSGGPLHLLMESGRRDSEGGVVEPAAVAKSLAGSSKNAVLYYKGEIKGKYGSERAYAYPSGVVVPDSLNYDVELARARRLKIEFAREDAATLNRAVYNGVLGGVFGILVGFVNLPFLLRGIFLENVARTHELGGAVTDIADGPAGVGVVPGTDDGAGKELTVKQYVRGLQADGVSGDEVFHSLVERVPLEDLVVSDSERNRINIAVDRAALSRAGENYQKRVVSLRERRRQVGVSRAQASEGLAAAQAALVRAQQSAVLSDAAVEAGVTAAELRQKVGVAGAVE